ncbi:carbohydrate-binding protein [Vallitalea sediminicola]
MKKKCFRNLVTFVICFVLMLNISGLSISAQTTPNIQLYSAKLVTTYPSQYGIHEVYYSATGYINVKNLSADKNITVHYTYDGSNWLDQSASYLKTLEDGSEVWTFKTPEQTYPTYPINHQVEYNCKFAVKYEVDGNTYWDNNNGDNYLLQHTTMIYNAPCTLSKSAVMLNDSRYNDYNKSIIGSIYVKNLAYDKNVKVRYTLDNWQTYNEVDANYTRTYDNNTELWSFDIYGLDDYQWNNYHFAISYTVNGVTYWDNNFGDNYNFTK